MVVSVRRLHRRLLWRRGAETRCARPLRHCGLSKSVITYLNYNTYESGTVRWAGRVVHPGIWTYLGPEIDHWREGVARPRFSNDGNTAERRAVLNDMFASLQ